jgi:hypothetical protein
MTLFVWYMDIVKNVLTLLNANRYRPLKVKGVNRERFTQPNNPLSVKS